MVGTSASRGGTCAVDVPARRPHTPVRHPDGTRHLGRACPRHGGRHSCLHHSESRRVVGGCRPAHHAPRSGRRRGVRVRSGGASAIRSDRLPVRPGPRQKKTRSGHPTTGAHVDAWGLQPSARRRQLTAVLAGNHGEPPVGRAGIRRTRGVASPRKSVAAPPVPGRAYGTDGERSAMATAPAKPPTAMTRSVSRRPALGQPVYGVPNAQNRDSWFTQSGHPNSGTR